MYMYIISMRFIVSVTFVTINKVELASFSQQIPISVRVTSNIIPLPCRYIVSPDFHLFPNLEKPFLEHMQCHILQLFRRLLIVACDYIFTFSTILAFRRGENRIDSNLTLGKNKLSVKGNGMKKVRKGRDQGYVYIFEVPKLVQK